jgi:hypothetical protein
MSELYQDTRPWQNRLNFLQLILVADRFSLGDCWCSSQVDDMGVPRRFQLDLSQLANIKAK